nr:DnaJ domain-containing protein [uncultured Cohaesibacter sp.]
MKLADALSILDLASGATKEEITKAYKTAAKKYHPDINPAGAEMMKLVNAAYDVLKSAETTETKEEAQADYGEALNTALNAVVNLEGLEIEICGAWIWVSGNTFPHKAALKSAGFRWASKKKMWNFRPSNWKSKSRGATSMDDIREKYGSARPFRSQSAQSKQLDAA